MNDDIVFKGEANGSGFFLSVRSRKHGKIFTIESRDYNEGQNESLVQHLAANRKRSKYATLLSLLLFFLLVFSTYDCTTIPFLSYILITIFWFILTIYAALIFAVLATSQLFFKKENQWHACEHKAVNLLSHFDKITMENLKKESRCHLKCGTHKDIYRFGPVLFLFFCSFPYLIRPSSKCLVILLYLAIILGLYTTIKGGFNFFIQYFFMTKKPTEEQLKETLRVAKIIREEIASFSLEK